ncbi:MAG: methyltransferase [Brachybacterium sp.]|uniref:class I SAM-dependent methyltransferase n=1 Tax=Brachybacterium sp. TaxID=1891286 RepID=UPI002648CBBF|nr:methyltransferase domain-containing protein [Brachybacterium sp.]MDN5687366.1 methyltransferase [Brachybacterium sp.]
MQRCSSDRDFSAYNAAQQARPVRLLARRAVELAAERSRTDGSGTAVELGCGIGVEARFLAENGLTVHTVDADASVEPAMAALSADLPVHHRTTELAQLRELPPADLILSCATLPFVQQPAFDALWSRMRYSLLPRGVLAVDLFGDRDDWADTDGTYLSRSALEALFDGLEIIELTEEERDGRSFDGRKHWHTFRVIARRP